MDNISYQLMEELLGPASLEGLCVLDVASYDVNGTLRPLVEGLGGQYTGCDVREGPNVDVVIPEFTTWPRWLAPAFDVVLCANALHNMARPWRVISECARVLMPGGRLCVVAAGMGVRYPSNYPRDYYRFAPDGLRALMLATGVLHRVDIRESAPHVGGVAYKV